MAKKVITSAIVTASGITLYTPEGPINLPATGWRTKSIMDEITPLLAARKHVEIDIDSYSIEAKVEAASGGILKFVKRKLRDFVGHFNLGSYGYESVSDNTLAKSEELLRVQQELKEAPLRNPDEETTVAIVNGVEIPGMEKLEKQMEYAAFTNSKGLEKFLARIATVIDKRGHSVQELLNFMENGDLPIADDGTIIGYKILCHSPEGTEGVFVDPHSRKVYQRVGSRVSMAEALVDPSRRTQCSAGLHIARRGYVSGFGYDLITLVKVAPEDVIAVPDRERDKMRACAYHIVAQIPPEGYSLLRNNSPMTTHEPSAKILANVIAGDHIGIVENVVIGGPKGTKIVTTPTRGITPAALESVAETKTEVKKAEALDEKPRVDPTVMVKEVKAAVETVVKEEKAKKEAKAKVVAEKKAAKAAPVVKGPMVSSKKGGINKQPSKVKERPAAPAKMSQAQPAKTIKVEKVSESVKVRAIPEKWKEAYERVKNGEISQRQAEKQYNISAKKLRALRREIEGK